MVPKLTVVSAKMVLYPYKKHPPFQGSGVENHVSLKSMLGGVGGWGSGETYAAQHMIASMKTRLHFFIPFVFFVSKGNEKDMLQVTRKNHIL